jgi:hypothetical protein
MEVGLPLVISMDIKRMVFSKIKLKLMHPSQIGLGANAAPGDIRYVDVNGDNVIDARIELMEIRFKKRRWDSTCK